MQPYFDEDADTKPVFVFTCGTPDEYHGVHCIELSKPLRWIDRLRLTHSLKHYKPTNYSFIRKIRFHSATRFELTIGGHIDETPRANVIGALNHEVARQLSALNLRPAPTREHVGFVHHVGINP